MDKDQETHELNDIQAVAQTIYSSMLCNEHTRFSSNPGATLVMQKMVLDPLQKLLDFRREQEWHNMVKNNETKPELRKYPGGE